MDTLPADTKSTLFSAVADLEKALEELAKTRAELEARLAPIMCPMTAGVAAEKSEREHATGQPTRMTLRIGNLVRDLSRQTKEIAVLNERLDL